MGLSPWSGETENEVFEDLHDIFQLLKSPTRVSWKSVIFQLLVTLGTSQYIVQDVIRFGTLALHSQNKAFLGEMINIQNVEEFLNFTKMKKGGAKRGGGALWGLSKNTDSMKNGDFFGFFAMGAFL